MHNCSEQVHLVPAGDGALRVIFLTEDDEIPSEVRFWGTDKIVHTAKGSFDAYSSLIYWNDYLVHPPMGNPAMTTEEILALENTSSWAIDPNTGERTSAYKEPTSVKYFDFGAYTNPAMYYNSPMIHTVLLTGLAPDASYSYQVAGDDRTFSFQMPPAPGSSSYPLTLGLAADLGQTAVSEANFAKLKAGVVNAAGSHRGIVLVAGDLSYADGYYPLWDSFGRLVEDLASTVPILSAGGNHEVGSGENWLSFNSRYPMPSRESGSPSNTWFAHTVGPARVITLCSYCATNSSSLQYKWLKRELKQIDRCRTPWVLVMMHTPWYSSNTVHWEEAELMRKDMEPLLYAAGVDLVLNGHVHAVERTHPLYNWTVNPCGITYLTLGDGGNREGAALPYREPAPAWSAFREGSFGIGLLTLHNSTHAYYSWTRSACEGQTEPDHINFNTTCESITSKTKDNGGFSDVTSDELWITRSTRTRGECVA